MRKLAAASVVAGAAIAATAVVFPNLPSKSLIGRQPNGAYLLPTSQEIKNWGTETRIKGRPVDWALDSSGKLFAVLNMSSVDLLDRATHRVSASIPALVPSYAGVAFRPGTHELWFSRTASRGHSGDSIEVFDVSDPAHPTPAASIEIANHGVPCGIAFTPDGKTAFIALSRANTLAVIDAEKRQIRKQLAVGIAPFGVVVSAKTGRVFVTNRGGRQPESGDITAPTSGSEAVTDQESGSTTSGTLSVVSLKDLSVREIATGLAPSALALNGEESSLAVANGHSDSVSIFDTRTLARVDAPVPQFPSGAFGSQPVAVTWLKSGRLAVGCGGTNAVVLFEQRENGWRVIGAAPSDWFPTALMSAQDGSLDVLTIKGVGNNLGEDGAHNTHNYEGSLLHLPAMTDAQWRSGVAEVAAANEPHIETPAGARDWDSLGIRHVFLIIKENRTYDQVFGDLPRGNNDPKLVMFGKDVTPNQHALAEQFVQLDNFYADGAISFDGHQWLMMSFVSDYTERAFAGSPRGYAWNMADALTVSPKGFFWQGSANPPSIRIYGEFCEPASYDPKTGTIVDVDERDQLTWAEYWKMYKDGTWREKVRERSGVPTVAKYLEPDFPFNSTVVPDQMRADSYLTHFAQMEKDNSLPAISVIALPANHTNGTRPSSATPRALVADNDLAVGRIIEAVSKSEYWKSSVFFMVEDDAQNGRDHVDGHRTVLTVAGPRVRRGVLDSNLYTQSSIIRTIQEIFHIRPQTRAVLAARPLSSIFSASADTKPYQCLPSRIPLDEMNPPLHALRGEQRWAARQSLAMDFSHPDEARAETLNRVLEIEARRLAKAQAQRTSATRVSR